MLSRQPSLILFSLGLNRVRPPIAFVALLCLASCSRGPTHVAEATLLGVHLRISLTPAHGYLAEYKRQLEVTRDGKTEKRELFDDSGAYAWVVVRARGGQLEVYDLGGVQFAVPISGLPMSPQYLGASTLMRTGSIRSFQQPLTALIRLLLSTRPSPNHAVERTTTRCAFTFCLARAVSLSRYARSRWPSLTLFSLDLMRSLIALLLASAALAATPHPDASMSFQILSGGVSWTARSYAHGRASSGCRQSVSHAIRFEAGVDP